MRDRSRHAAFALAASLLAMCGCAARQPGLDDALRTAIRQPAPRQFSEPESVLRFVHQQLVAKDMTEVMRAFPIVEQADNVTLEVSLRYLPGFVPMTMPLDDERFFRLERALEEYVGMYRGVVLALLGIEARSGATDASPLKTVKLSALTARSDPPEINAIEKAMGVTEKRWFDMTFTVGARDVPVSAAVGRIADGWRVLFLSPPVPDSGH
jgi:hypothetical protein